MTAPSTFTVSGTWYHPDGSLAAGTVELTPTASRFKNNSNVLPQETIVVALAAGAISQLLVQATAGYDVVEKITGLDGTVRVGASYHIAGTSNINLGT